MPKSRGRKRKHHHNAPHRGGPHRSYDTAQAVADFPIVQATDQAEARGDAMATLDLIQRDLKQGRGGDFWRPSRLTRLSQLAAFSEVLPRWATSRWILEQAAQALDNRTRHRAVQAIDIAVATRGGARTLIGTDRADARAKVMDHDWVFRQVWLYELGALQHFLTEIAAPDLLAGADHIHEWARAPMGAFRIREEAPRTLTWERVATGEEVTSINLGSASLLLPDECAIGRLVPVEGGAMFETVPLFVPDDVARRVADDPHDWLAAVSDGCRREGPPRQRIGTSGHDFRLLTDVPIGIQYNNVRIGLEQTGEPHAEEELDSDPTAAQAAFVRWALDGRLDVDDFWVNPWPSVAASLLHPSVFMEVVLSLGVDDASRLERLALSLPSPAHGICRALALDVRRAA